MKKNQFFIILAVLSLGIFGLDMWIKYAILQQFDYKPYPMSQSVSVWGEFFKLTYIQNHGITFGLFNNLPKTQSIILLSTTSTIALIVLGYFFIRIETIIKPTAIKSGKIALAMILGGALGNIVDRLIRGFVVDYLDFGWAGYRWYTFNFADVFIVSGCILLSILMIFFEQKQESK